MENSPIQQIKERLDIIEVIGSYLRLQKTGANFRALCPFHSEKKPSFFVSPARQMFKCFGCGSGGSIFDFIMKIEGVEFGDALRLLAQKAGVELKPITPELKTERARLYEICELACRFFKKQLRATSAGEQVRDYLLKRGLNDDSIKKWRLGYAPESWQGLSDFLVSKGYQREEVVKAGLTVESEKTQTPYDRFRGRIIFPILDLNSQVIGFGARVFKDSEKETAKYINTPNTLLYDKSRVLYGLNFAKLEIRKKEECFLVEGYLDVILAHQAGFENTVGTSGTALTPFQLRILKRYTSNLLTAFDMDAAGDFATKKGIDLAQKEDFEVKVVSLPKDSDPAEIISKDVKKWGKLTKEAKEIMAFYFESALGKFDKETAEGKKGIAKILLPKIKGIPNKILKYHWIQKLSQLIRVPEEAITEELKKTKEEISQESQVVPEETEERKEKKDKSKQSLLEERILSLLLKSPQNLELLDKDCLGLFSPKTKEILTFFKKGSPENFEENLKTLKEKEDRELKKILVNSTLGAEFEEVKEPKIEISLCLKELKRFFLKNKLMEISEEIGKAEREGKEKKVKELIGELNTQAKKLKDLDFV